MKINLEFLGLPLVTNVTGKKKLELDVPGRTVKDVIDELIRRYGKKMKDALCDPQGNFDMTIQISLNWKFFIPVDKHDTPLTEGDNLIFMLLVAGG